jgi:L-lactate dehydrogenase
MKVSIIGGAGRVGSNAAYALQLVGWAREIALVDVMAEQAEGEALDLRHGASLANSQLFTSGGYDQVAGSDVIVITAGLRRKPDEPRLALVNRNVALFRSILAEVGKVSLPSNAILLIVANPVDILTQIAVKESGFPRERVIGTGTLLDTTRFRSFLGEHFGVAQTQVDALILGEHGDSMVPIWSSATINGVPLASFPGYQEQEVRAIFDATKKSGARVIALKGGAGYSIGLVVAHVVNAIAGDTKQVLPVSTLQTGLHGINDVCLSVPTVIGRGGAEALVEMQLAPEEEEALQNSARVLKETFAQLSA